MKKITFWKSLFLLFALIVGSNSVWATDYVKVTSASDLVAGEVYVIAEISNSTTKYLVTGYGSKLTNTTSGFSVSNNTITTSTATPLEFTLGTVTSGNNTYYTLKYSSSDYLGYSGSSTNFETATTTTNTKEQWSITPSTSDYRILNVSSNTRYIGRYGSSIGPYSTSNSYPNCYLFKKQAANVNSLSIGTAPTKVNYKVGEKLDLTGLKLNADGKEVTTGYTAKIGETTVTSGTTALNDVGAQTITFSYGGKTCNQVIHVGALQSIALTTTGVKTEYNAGQTFDPTNLVVKASFSDEETTATEWEETLDEEDYTYTPDGALTTSNDKVTVSYTWAEVEKTADINISVNAATAYTVTFNAGTGSCATASLTEATGLAGVTLPAATIGVTGWTFAGWAEASTTNTEVAPTLYAATTTYHPVDNVTLYAVYKYVDGTEYKRATALANITNSSSIVIVSNSGTKLLNSDIATTDAPTETSSKISITNTKAIFELSGNSTDGYTLSNGGSTLGAAGTDNSTVLSMTSSNNTWKIAAHNTSNTFYFENTAKDNLCMEYYSSGSGNVKWLVYAPNTPSSNANMSMRVYVPVTVYNSNPAAIINPTVAFEKTGDKKLYLKGEKTYTNAANVTGIDKAPTYSLSNTDVAYITSDGIVTAKAVGTTTVTATIAAEPGVNTKATASYELTVKDASSIAELKTIDNSTSGGYGFKADLTDAVVTYVKDNHAYIQDASAAIYVTFANHGLVAGQKINGAVSGTVKTSYSIDQIIDLDLSEATVTADGVIPDALVKTTAQIRSAGTELDAQRVTVTGATASGTLDTDAYTNNVTIKDASTSTVIIYAPNKGIEVNDKEEGSFTGFVSVYNGNSYRLNIYDQSQIVLTKNAPTAQPLAFTEDDVVLDEETAEYDAFAGQTVSGAQGTVSYAITSDANNIITSLNAETGAIVLSGAYGTATITATAAAANITEAGVITPYTETSKSYTVTTYPRYTSTFSVNGVETVVRQATHGAEITIPEPSDVGDYYFMGWKASTGINTPTDVAPEMVTPPATPTNNVTYYAVYAYGTGSPVVEHTSTFTVKQASEPSTSPYVSDGSSWTWSNVEFANDASAKIKSSNGSITFTLPNNGKAKTLKITKTSNAWSSSCNVILKDASNNSLKTFSLGSSASSTYTFTSTYDHSASYTLSNSTSYNAWTDNIEFKYETGGISYSGYRTSLPVVGVTIPASGYLSYCSPYKLDFSETNVKAYTASVDNTGTVTLTKVDVVPAEEGVVLFSSEAQTANEAKDYTVPVTAEDASDVTGNQMVGVLARTQVEWNPSDGVYNYILQQGEFRKATTPGGYLKANRAYLSTSYDVTAAGARPLTIVFEGETTRISNVNANDNFDDNAPMYNLAGQKVGKSYKGIVIQNGKKILKK